ncbi:MAG: glucose-6-phosphate isomerase [Flavobacteriaceae bacterium]
MTLSNHNPTRLPSWLRLQDHFKKIAPLTIADHFAASNSHSGTFQWQWDDFYVDLSKNRWNEETLSLLLKLAEEAELSNAISAYFGGDAINQTENRAVLHTALRQKGAQQLLVDGKDIIPEIEAVKEKMYAFSEAVISGEWKGYSGKPITHVVNIGIGGSDLGPAMVTEALAFYKNHLEVRFVSNVEGDHVQESLKGLSPETTLFVVVSKTFTTQETLSNAQTIRRWFLETAPETAIAQHFVAVSTNLEKIEAFGIAPENVFPMNDWVGGRFSLWSAVGLSICLGVGPQHFDHLLQGAGAMDAHFKSTSFENNIPVLLALLSVWYNNFWEAETEVIVPYTQYLRSLPAYLQQAIMESNGKGTDRNGNPVTYQTGTIVWGAPGTNAQHAFFQLLHQGTKLIPADFIGFKKSLYGETDHQAKLMANFVAQTEALMKGKSAEKVADELHQNGMAPAEARKLIPFKVFEGNRPTNTILIEQLTPKNLGALIACYEHKIFVQGILWNIFSYDQWGVELGKQLANVVLDDFNAATLQPHDASTSQLINRLKKS